MCVIDALSAPAKVKPGRTGRDVHDLADDTAVHDRDGEFVGMVGSDPLDPAANAVLELVGRFAAGDHVPALLDVHQLCDRVVVGDPPAELAALPLTEEHLAQVGDDDRFDAQPGDQRGRRLVRPLQGRDVHRGDALAGVDQSLRRQLRLLLAFRSEGRIPVSVDETELLALDVGCGLAMAHQQDLGRAGGRGESGLRKLARFGHPPTLPHPLPPRLCRTSAGPVRPKSDANGMGGTGWESVGRLARLGGCREGWKGRAGRLQG